MTGHEIGASLENDWVWGTDIVHTAEVRVARPLHCWYCVLNPGQTALIRGDWSKDRSIAGKTIGSGAGLPTELEVKSRFLSVRSRGGPEVWLARCVLVSPRGWAYEGFSQ